MNKNMTPKNENNQPHGYWEYYRWSGKLWYKYLYINGVKIGFGEQYWSDGKVSYKKYYL